MKLLNDYGYTPIPIDDIEDIDSINSNYGTVFIDTDPYGNAPNPTPFDDLKNDGVMDYSPAPPYMAYPIPGKGRQVWAYIMNENLYRINAYFFDLVNIIDTRVDEVNDKFDSVENSFATMADSVNGYILDKDLTEYNTIRYMLSKLDDNVLTNSDTIQSLIENLEGMGSQIDDTFWEVTEDLLILKQNVTQHIIESEDYSDSLRTDVNNISMNLSTTITKLQTAIALMDSNFEDYFEFKLETKENLTNIYGTLYDYYVWLNNITSSVDSNNAEITALDGRVSNNETDIDNIQTDWATNIVAIGTGLLDRVNAVIIADVSTGGNVLVDDIIYNSAIVDGEVYDEKLHDAYIKLNTTTNKFQAVDKAGLYYPLDMGNNVITGIQMATGDTTQVVNEAYVLTNFIALTNTVNGNTTSGQVVSRDLIFDGTHRIKNIGHSNFSDINNAISLGDMVQYSKLESADYVITNRANVGNHLTTFQSWDIFRSYIQGYANYISSESSLDYLTNIAVKVMNVDLEVQSLVDKSAIDSSYLGTIDVSSGAIPLIAKNTSIIAESKFPLKLKMATTSGGTDIEYATNSGEFNSTLFVNATPETVNLKLENISFSKEGVGSYTVNQHEYTNLRDYITNKLVENYNATVDDVKLKLTDPVYVYDDTLDAFAVYVTAFSLCAVDMGSGVEYRPALFIFKFTSNSNISDASLMYSNYGSSTANYTQLSDYNLYYELIVGGGSVGNTNVIKVVEYAAYLNVVSGIASVNYDMWSGFHYSIDGNSTAVYSDSTLTTRPINENSTIFRFIDYDSNYYYYYFGIDESDTNDRKLNIMCNTSGGFTIASNVASFTTNSGTGYNLFGMTGYHNDSANVVMTGGGDFSCFGLGYKRYQNVGYHYTETTVETNFVDTNETSGNMMYNTARMSGGTTVVKHEVNGSTHSLRLLMKTTFGDFGDTYDSNRVVDMDPMVNSSGFDVVESESVFCNANPTYGPHSSSKNYYMFMSSLNKDPNGEDVNIALQQKTIESTSVKLFGDNINVHLTNCDINIGLGSFDYDVFVADNCVLDLSKLEVSSIVATNYLNISHTTLSNTSGIPISIELKVIGNYLTEYISQGLTFKDNQYTDSTNRLTLSLGMYAESYQAGFDVLKNRLQNVDLNVIYYRTDANDYEANVIYDVERNNLHSISFYQSYNSSIVSEDNLLDKVIFEKNIIRG